jgi:hypothetical protein
MSKGAPPGSKEYLSKLQNAITKLWKAVPEADKQVYANLAQKWSSEAPPPKIQSRYTTPAFYLP